MDDPNQRLFVIACGQIRALNTGLSCKKTPTYPKRTERITISWPPNLRLLTSVMSCSLMTRTSIASQMEHFQEVLKHTAAKWMDCCGTLWLHSRRGPIAKPGNSVMTHCRLQCVSCRRPRPHPSTGAKSCCVATNPSSPSIQSWHIAGVSSTVRSCVVPPRRCIAAKTSRPIPHCQSPRLVCRQFCWSQAL